MANDAAKNKNRRTFTKSALLTLLGAICGPASAASGSTRSGQVNLQAMPSRPWADPASLVISIAAGTVAVENVADSVRAYREGLGYVEHWRGKLSVETAEFWDAPEMAGKTAAVVGPRELQSGLIRFVELGSEFRRIESHTTLGWAALEIRAKNVDAMPGQLAGSAIMHTNGPADLKFGSGPPSLRAVQFKGPSGEPLYFTQDLQFDRSPLIGKQNVGGVFLQTLVAVPYIKTRDLYLRSLGMQLRVEASVPRSGVARQSGAEPGKMYRMASVRAPEYNSVQIDEYPGTIGARPRTPGYLPSGVAMCTLRVRSIELVAAALQEIDVPFRRLASNSVPPYVGTQALCCVGFSGEIIEFVEA